MSVWHRIRALPDVVDLVAFGEPWRGPAAPAPPDFLPLLRCTPCAVTWRGAEPCWMCGQPGEDI